MTDKTAVLLLAAPLQSWGVRSPIMDFRDSWECPTRSGVIGLISAALGNDRHVDPSWSETLRMMVRIDRRGDLLRDFHTIGGGDGANPFLAADGKRRGAKISRRIYLADAAFVVTLTGPTETIDSIERALANPVYVPFLGLKSCPPEFPPLLGVSEEEPLTLLSRIPLYLERVNARPSVETPSLTDDVCLSVDATTLSDTVRTRVIVENPDYATATLNDRPASYNHWDRKWRSRDVGEEYVNVPVAGRGLDAVADMRAAIHETRGRAS